MQDAELFLSLAGIAGVFVGFGALIAARSGGPSGWQEIAPMRVVVAMGMLTVVAALAPVTMGRYDLTEHQVWALSGAITVVGWLLLVYANARTPEWREGWRGTSVTGVRWTPGEVVGTVVYVLYMIAVLLAPIVIVLGVAADLEAALYFTNVVLILIGAAWSLLGLVYLPRPPESA